MLSVEVEASLALLDPSCAAPAPMLATTVPEPVMPLTDTVYLTGPPVTIAVSVPGAVLLLRSTSDPSKSVTASLNTTSKSMGLALVGFCPADCRPG